jgi:hypothetical protein
MSLSFEEAVSQPAPRFAAWDITPRGDEALVSIFTIDRAGGGATQVASKRVRASERDVVTAGLVEAGLAVGGFDFNCDFVWVDQPTGFVVYDNRARRLLADATHLHLLFDEVVRKGDLASVEAFAGDDFIERGVRATTADGTRLELVVEHAMSAASDPDYDRNDLLFETGWCEVVGRKLAEWADVPFENRI